MPMDSKNVMPCLECFVVVAAVMFYFYRHSFRFGRLMLVILALRTSVEVDFRLY
jgi:hypothetical protein